MSNRTTQNDHSEEEDRPGMPAPQPADGRDGAAYGEHAVPGSGNGADTGHNGDRVMNEELLFEVEAEDALVLEAIIDAVDSDTTPRTAIEPLADIEAPSELDEMDSALDIEIERVNFDVGATNLDDSV
ncbi:MAG: hypothetical protein KC438_14105, partial [Thermomicrobiales bacterium]|nr:hypothetical protein [Thermomicrobiales bacterium]